MANKCFSLLRGEAMRATRLDRCGNISDAECSSITTDGFISVAFTTNVTEGEAVTVTKANGKQCVNDTPAPEFNNVGVTVTFCNVDPELYAMLTNQPVEYDAAGDAVGFRMRKNVSLNGAGVALELWSNVPAESCEGGEGTWGYMLLPFLQGGVLGDFTLENNAVTFTIQGMVTKSGGAWGAGPYNVVMDELDAPGPLNEPMTSDDHFLVRWTNVAPPEPGCSCTTVADAVAAQGMDGGEAMAMSTTASTTSDTSEAKATSTSTGSKTKTKA